VQRALALFDPVWDALTLRERASLLHELIESIDYDGHAGEIAIAFRPTGIAALSAEAQEAAA
jgi:site-specific DNA recombinase